MPYIIQKYILKKYNYSVHLLALDGNILWYVIYREECDIYSIQCGGLYNYVKCDLLNNSDFEIIKYIFNKCNYTGLACIDFTYELDTNKMFIFEINHRIGDTLTRNTEDFNDMINIVCDNYQHFNI